jgi:hypothetical protein
MFRQLFLWSVFAGCLLILLAAVGWMSLVAVRLDRAESQSRRQALIEEQVRLALWRMDSSLAPLLLQESARPLAAYQALRKALLVPMSGAIYSTREMYHFSWAVIPPLRPGTSCLHRRCIELLAV